jgi:4-hydroxy-tetrahydrodipicolinate synthase
LESIREGARGLSAISANFYPELYMALLRDMKNKEHMDRVDLLQQHLSIMDAITRIKYPLNAKLFLAGRGLKIEPYTRVNVVPLTYEEKKMLDALYNHFIRISAEYKF